jgi:glycosyltransferase involved in cell wall biosynthesis
LIAHLTTVHNRNDVRIFHKEIKSISKIKRTILLVSDGLESETIDNVEIINVGINYKSRMKRFIINSLKMLRVSVKLNADIYHFHDPELIFIGLILKLMGKRVFYDSHEDLPRQLNGKPYLNKWIRHKLPNLVEKIENFSAKRFDYIIAATPFIRERFLKINQNCIDINNYPIHNVCEFELKYREKKNEICYLGGISEIRGIYELIESLEYSKVILNLAGDFKDENFEIKCKKLPGWNYVKFHGYVNRNEVNNLLNVCKIGIVTLHPLINYLDSLPVKMFEYMSAGIPIIASNFPLWKSIIEKNECGICVDPKSPKEISDAVIYLMNNPKIAEKMGKNGQNAIVEKYNWSLEEKKLFKAYKSILKN